MQKFRSNARPLNSGLEKNALHIWIQNDLSFSKLFEISKLDEKWQVNNPNENVPKKIKQVASFFPEMLI